MDKNKEGRKKHIKKGTKGKQFDSTFKIVMIGDSGVGKSCILLRFADDKFNENFYATIGVDFRFKNLTVDDKQIKLQIVKKNYIIYFYIFLNKYSGTQQAKKNLKQ